jgi:hypothetical protein
MSRSSGAAWSSEAATSSALARTLSAAACVGQVIDMDYDKFEIATIYDEARALTPDRSQQWRNVFSTYIDRTTISVVVDLG